MVFVSILPHEGFGRNDHREDGRSTQLPQIAELFSDDDFPCLEIGGQEFPVIDMYNSLMYEYDHFWSNGFGTTLPDRLGQH